MAVAPEEVLVIVKEVALGTLLTSKSLSSKSASVSPVPPGKVTASNK